MVQQPPLPVTNQPYYNRRHQGWSVDNLRTRHEQALRRVGEPALITLMWRVEDFEAGYVQRCPRCLETPGTVQGDIESVYGQPLTARCPVCYGTTFDGGIRAQIIRPTIITDADEDEVRSARGVIHPETVSVETTNDFRARTGDFVFRRDGSRWVLGRPQRIQVRTGYEHPTQAATSIGYARISATREDESHVAYDLPPFNDELSVLLDVTSPFPEQPRYEVINGPLIPGQESE